MTPHLKEHSPAPDIGDQIVFKFTVGQQVVYTNDYGVCWGVKEIIGLATRSEKPCYYIRPTDAPWFPVSEAQLSEPDAEDLQASSLGFFQAKYGRETTLEERRALLDTDPFDGEA